MFVFLWLLLLPFWMLVISEGARSHLLPILILFSPPIFLAQVFCTSITRAYRFPLGFICSVFPLCFFIRSARPLRPGQIFCGVVADLLSREPVRRPGFSARLGFLSARDFGLRFSHCVRSSCLCFGLFVCCAPVPSTPGEFVKVAILFGNCLLLCSYSFSCLVNLHCGSEVLFEFIFWVSVLMCRNNASHVDLQKLVSSMNSFVLWFRLLQVRVNIVLKSPDQGLKLSGFSSYSWGWFLSHAHQMFGKICGMFWVACRFDFVFCCVSISLARFWGPLAFR
jgi:hypothetical protein